MSRSQAPRGSRRSRKAEMDTSLQARIYDPLWLLQWQFGEFEGEDNGRLWRVGEENLRD